MLIRLTPNGPMGRVGAWRARTAGTLMAVGLPARGQVAAARRLIPKLRLKLGQGLGEQGRLRIGWRESSELQTFYWLSGHDDTA